MNLLGSLCEHIADIIMGQQCFQYITYIILTTLVYELNCAEMNMFLNGKKYIVKMDLNISERFYTCLRGERTQSCTVLLKDSIKNTDLPAYDVKQNNGTITYSDPAFQCELQKSCTLYVVCFGPFDTYTLICKVNNKKCSDVHACGDRYFKIFWTNNLDSLADKELTLCQSNSSCSSYAQKWTSITTELYGNTEITNTAAHRYESTLTSLYNSTNTDSRDGAQSTSTSNIENVRSGSTSMNEASHNNF
uniref:Uncharacterized protein n=1 Tax=Biomphalaria glabrata TaxID=6526 RepID=A0A2C9LF51_BIOGL